ncbi:hypothetical protein, partial [Nonomuraea lactucae]|uniref:hypothetical protein n=1 Tax=Nonomuraea lactucae TaxID=2249762 RepID=UPI001962E113
MARHDREESLEEQLAWLDAIKETEEAPLKVSSPAPSADEPVASPYPKDPWLSVPSQQDTPTPPLFRAAVDSVYGSQAAERLPDGESEAAEWLESATAKDEAAPDGPPESLGRTESLGRSDSLGGADSPGRADDAFLAPLKPLPRPDDTDPYSLSFPGAYHGADTLPRVEPQGDVAPDPLRADPLRADRVQPERARQERNKWPEPPEWPRPPEALDEPRPADGQRPLDEAR